MSPRAEKTKGERSFREDAMSGLCKLYQTTKRVCMHQADRWSWVEVNFLENVEWEWTDYMDTSQMRSWEFSQKAYEGNCKGFYPNCIQHFLENIDIMSRNDGSRELFPVFHNPHWKGWSSPPCGTLGGPLRALVWIPVSILNALSRSNTRRRRRYILST